MIERKELLLSGLEMKCLKVLMYELFLYRRGPRRGDSAPQLSFSPFLVIATCTTAGAGQTTDCYARWLKHTLLNDDAIIHGVVPSYLLCFFLLSPHVQSVAAGYGGERRLRRHAGGQQAASPSAAGPYPECTFAPVAPGPPAAGGPTATPALPGETLQGTRVHSRALQAGGRT